MGLKKHQSRSNRSVVELAALAPPDTGAVGDGTTRAGGPIPDFLAAGAHAAKHGGQDVLVGALNGTCLLQIIL